MVRFETFIWEKLVLMKRKKIFMNIIIHIRNINVRNIRYYYQIVLLDIIRIILGILGILNIIHRNINELIFINYNEYILNNFMRMSESANTCISQGEGNKM